MKPALLLTLLLSGCCTDFGQGCRTTGPQSGYVVSYVSQGADKPWIKTYTCADGRVSQQEGRDCK